MQLPTRRSSQTTMRKITGTPSDHKRAQRGDGHTSERSTQRAIHPRAPAARGRRRIRVPGNLVGNGWAERMGSRGREGCCGPPEGCPQVPGTCSPLGRSLKKKWGGMGRDRFVWLRAGWMRPPASQGETDGFRRALKPARSVLASIRVLRRWHPPWQHGRRRMRMCW